jgi:UMF1 family MFS transporter
MQANPTTPAEERRGLLAWAFYDWANSSFAAIIQTFIFAAYFTRQVAENETLGSSQWGIAIGLSGLLVALGGPILGAIADQSGRRKPWIAGFTLLCVVATALLWWIEPGPGYVWPALLLVALATLGAEFAVIFYNAMLPDLAPPERVGRWSGWAWGLGYAGGVACLVLALVAFIDADSAWFTLDRTAAEHVRITFPLVSLWYLLFALPLLLWTPDAAASGKKLLRATHDGLHQLAESIRNVRRYGAIIRFLIARMIFIDGLATLFAFGGVYAAGTFDMDEQTVLMFGIALNLSAAVGAFAFAWFDDWYGSRTTILLSLIGLIATGSAILLVDEQLWFWIWGLLLGIFVGPVQAASRSYLARVAPVHLRTEMFGLFALSGKATAFLGPLLVSWVTYVSASQRVGMAVIIVLFVLGLLLMLTVPSERGARTGPAALR